MAIQSDVPWFCDDILAFVPPFSVCVGVTVCAPSGKDDSQSRHELAVPNVESDMDLECHWRA